MREKDTDHQPFSIDDILTLGSLSEIFEHLVFEHPAVTSLRPSAIKAADLAHCPFEVTAGFVSPVIGLDQPVVCIRHVSHQRRRMQETREYEAAIRDRGLSKFDRPYPPALKAYYDAIKQRIGLLFLLLQERQLVAWAHTNDGHLVPLAHTIWSHENFYVHRYDGDVFEAGQEVLVKKWTGVTLARPLSISPDQMFPVKPPDPYRLRRATADDGEQPQSRSRASIRVETALAAETACGGWLEQMMRDSPRERKYTRDELWRMAQERWPTLAKRAFLRARDKAIEVSGAAIWKEAGASRKSQRMNRGG